jgi:hypothetical protein
LPALKRIDPAIPANSSINPVGRTAAAGGVLPDASIQNESNRLLITQGFSPLGVPNRRSQRTLENKSFFAASVPTRTEGDNDD